jgi:hypothetical protein
MPLMSQQRAFPKEFSLALVPPKEDHFRRFGPLE